MKTYCFNYAVEGVYTIAPIFICVDSSNKFRAWLIAKKYLSKKNYGHKVQVWFKNYPDMIDKKFQSTRVPKEFL